jgi:hypothetical protein
MAVPETTTHDDGNGAASVEAIRREAEARLQELEPLLEEAEKLRAVIAVIDGEIAQPPAAAADGAPATGAGNQPVRSGANKRRILAAIGRAPGITPREISVQTGIKRTVVASTVNRLKRSGEVRPHGSRGDRGGVALIDAPGAGRPAA